MSRDPWLSQAVARVVPTDISTDSFALRITHQPFAGASPLGRSSSFPLNLHHGHRRKLRRSQLVGGIQKLPSCAPTKRIANYGLYSARGKQSLASCFLRQLFRQLDGDRRHECSTR